MKKELINKLQESLQELVQSMPMQQAVRPKAKETVVTFDKNTQPFQVKFSERGFEIEETRFSFDFLKQALNKEVNIVLGKGNGLVLDSIKMNKILKYENIY